MLFCVATAAGENTLKHDCVGFSKLFTAISWQCRVSLLEGCTRISKGQEENGLRML